MRCHGCAKTRNRSRGVIKRHLKFMGVQNTTLARHALERFWAKCDFSVGHVLVSLIFTLVNTSITFFTMIALSNGAVIRWQPFGVSYLLGATALSWRNPISVTGVELNMCDVLFTFPWRSCWGSAVFTPSSVGGTWWARCMLVFLSLLRTGEILSLKAGQITLSVDSGVALLALPASKGAKLKNVGESVVVSDPPARALLAFLCRGCWPQHRLFRLSFKGLASARSSDLLPYSLRRGGCYFPLDSFWVHRFNDPLWALGPH